MNKKERAVLYKSQHRCTNCGKQDERTLAGKINCNNCANLVKGSIAKRYNNLKSQHRCVCCGRQDERTLAGKINCINCAKIVSSIMKKRYELLSGSGICIACGKSKAAVGKMCKSCSEKAKIRDIRRTMQYQSARQA